MEDCQVKGLGARGKGDKEASLPEHEGVCEGCEALDERLHLRRTQGTVKANGERFHVTNGHTESFACAVTGQRNAQV